MAASNNDRLTNTASTTTARPQPTQVTSARSSGGTTLPTNALVGWPTDTKVHYITYKLNTSGTKIAGSQIDGEAIVSGTNLTNIVIRGGTDSGNAIGDIVEMAPTAAWAYDLNKWGTVHADSQGNLLTSAVQSALGLSNLSGYTPLGATPNTVVYNGNRSYTLTFNSTDLTSIVSNGMRLRTTRTVTAPTQCTNLNGTSQYYSKSAPAGMTFTDKFTVSTWLKLSSYGLSVIGSRYNGTSGWEMELNASGQVLLIGYNGSGANYSLVQTYQSLPLNKWVHVAATLDMAAFAATANTASYIQIDGVDVPCTVSRAGTNPTSLLQAGNLEVGSRNGGSNPLPGKVAQFAVFNSKVTESTMLGYISQGLAGTETNLISAYSFNNSINDLNGTNSNNLTANSGAVATNLDSPFTQDDTGTPGGSFDYAIIQRKSFSTNTTLTVQVPEGCMIPTVGGISAVVYSSSKFPYGFPNTKSKWQVKALYLSGTQFAVNSSTYVNATGYILSVPAGEWIIGFEVDLIANSGGSAASRWSRAALSTSATTASDAELVSYTQWYNTGLSGGTTTKLSTASATAMTQYYLNVKSDGGVQAIVGFGSDVLYVENAYI